MRFVFWPGPNNPWNDALQLALHAESTGWDGIYYADHFMPNAADASGPTSECWTTLAALAARVPRIRLGALVTGNTYRHPAVLAKMAANVDNISGGRCVLGLGAGWQENEHAAYGIPFHTLGGRMRRLEEACQVVTGVTSATVSRATIVRGPGFSISKISAISRRLSRGWERTKCLPCTRSFVVSVVVS